MTDLVIPDYIRNAAAANAGVNTLTDGIGSSRGPHISFDNGQFLLYGLDNQAKPPMTRQNQILVNTQTGSRFIDIVVLGGAPGLAKVFYEGKFVRGTDSGPPDCWSNDGLYPDASIMEPQCDTCFQCPKNAFGSAITEGGKEAKACADRKRLAVLFVHDIYGPLYEFSVSPSNLKAWKAYAQEMEGRIPGGVLSIVTRMSQDPTKTGGIVFEPAPQGGVPYGTGYWFVPEPVLPTLVTARNSIEFKRAVGTENNGQQRRPALEAPRQQPALAAPQMTYTQPAEGFGGTPLGQPQPNAPIVYAQAAQPSGPAPGQSQALTAGAATDASQSAADASQARKPRRTKAEMEAARAAQQQPAQPSQQIAQQANYQPAEAVAQPAMQLPPGTYRGPDGKPFVVPGPAMQAVVAQPAGGQQAADPFAPTVALAPTQPSALAAQAQPMTGSATTAYPTDPNDPMAIPAHLRRTAEPASQPVQQPGTQFGIVAQPTMSDPAMDAMLAQAMAP